MLSVPDERSDESHLSGPPLNYQPAQSGILQQPLTMALWALFSTASKLLSDRDIGKKKKQCSSKSRVKATQHTEFKTLVHYFLSIIEEEGTAVAFPCHTDWWEGKSFKCYNLGPCHQIKHRVKELRGRSPFIIRAMRKKMRRQLGREQMILMLGGEIGLWLASNSV